MIKKLLSIIFAFTILSSCMISTAYADKSETITVSAGDEITYRMCVSPQDCVLSGVNLEVTYDTSFLKIVKEADSNKVSMPGLPSGMLNDDAEGMGQIIATYADGIKGTDLKDGLVILEATFNAIKSGETNITHNMKEFFDYDIEPIDKSVLYSEILLNGQPYGNVSADNTDNETKSNTLDPMQIVIFVAIAVVIVGGVAVLFVVMLKKENSKKRRSKK